MSLAFEQITAATMDSTQTLDQISANRVRELAGNSIYAQVTKQRKALQSPAISIAKQCEDFLGSSSFLGLHSRHGKSPSVRK